MREAKPKARAGMRAAWAAASVALVVAPYAVAGQDDAAPPAERPRSERVRTALETARLSLVVVELWLRRQSRLEQVEQAESGDYARLESAQLGESGLPFETFGVVLGADRIAIPEPGFDPDMVETARATWASGSVQADVSAIARRHGLWHLKPKAGADLRPIEFAPFEAPEPGEELYAARVERVDLEWQAVVEPLPGAAAPLRKDAGWRWPGEVRPGSVILDGRGRPIGVAGDQVLWVRTDGSSSFVGTDVAADRGLTLEALKHLERRVAASLLGSVRKIEITLRTDAGVAAHYREGGMDAHRLTVYGIPMDERGTFLVPQDTPRPTVRRIEEIRIHDGDAVREGTFVGLFRTLGASVIRGEGLATEAIRASGGPIRPGELFLACTLQEKAGATEAKLSPNRTFRIHLAVRDRESRGPRLVPRRPIRNGALILDLDGGVAGFFSTDKRDERAEDAAAGAYESDAWMWRSRAWYGHGMGHAGDPLSRIFGLKEFEPIFADPAPHFDPKATPMSKREASRLVWLGVEYQGLNRNLAEALKVMAPTKDGRRGLLVTRVYPDSAAERLGLREGDILLRIEAAPEPPIDLVSVEMGRFGFGHHPGYRMEMYEAMPVRAQRNSLNLMLTQIGEGRDVRLTLLREGAESELEVELERAPPDLESAEPYKCEPLGFTVKELTYEIRDFQRLPRDATGVVVAKIEPGGRAAVAKLELVNVVLRVQGVPVRDLDHFRRLIRGFLDGTGRSVTLETRHLGQTRFVDVERP